MTGTNSRGRITRKEFIRRATVGAAAAGAAAAALGGVARAVGVTNPNITQSDGVTPASGGESEIWVYPTGSLNPNPNAPGDLGDLGDVQWAIDNVAPRGTVLLKARNVSGVKTAFDFGPPPTASLTPNYLTVMKDLKIIGEPLTPESREPISPGGWGGWITDGTTIKGGGQMLWGKGWDSTTSPSIPASVTCRDIIFDGFGGGIKLQAQQPYNQQTGEGYSEIRGCKFINYRKGFQSSGASNVCLPVAAAGGKQEENIEALRGTFRVANNFFGSPSPLDPSYLNINYFNNCRLELEISGNKIEDIHWMGFSVFGQRGHTLIANNSINKSKSYAFDGIAVSVGATVQNTFSPIAYNGSTEIVNNEITVGSANTNAIIIVAYPESQVPRAPGQEAAHFVISGNKINMSSVNNTKTAIGLLGNCSNTLVSANTITGNGSYGILLSKAVTPPAVQAVGNALVSGNQISGNDLSKYTSRICQVYLDAFSKNNYFGPWTDAAAMQGYPPNSFGNSLLYIVQCQGSYNTFDGNTFGYAAQAQLILNPSTSGVIAYPSHNLFTNNIFGQISLSTPFAAVYCAGGDYNEFIKNDYRNTGLPGSYASPPNDAPCVILGGIFSGGQLIKVPTNNLVFESGMFPTIAGIETNAKMQVIDFPAICQGLGFGLPLCTGMTTNRVVGNSQNVYDKQNSTPGIGQRLQITKEQLDCQSSGGIWDAAMQTCTCPAGTALNQANGQCEQKQPTSEEMMALGFVWNEETQQWE